MTDRLTPLLAARPWLLADGATGSNLFHCGLQSGDAPELWNTEHPERIAELARAFIEAGADIILTNTFGGSSITLEEFGLARSLLDESGTPVLYEAQRGFSRSVHVLDPDGNEIELYVDISGD